MTLSVDDIAGTDSAEEDAPDASEYPTTVCRGCGYQLDDCVCPLGPPSEIVVVPDARAAVVRTYLRDHPELQKEPYDTDDGADPLLGLCYPAAEAWYHLQDCAPEVYCLSWASVDGVPDDSDATHWYLREPDGDRRWVDLALGDPPFDELPPFEQGTHRGFMTGDEPSKRAQQVLDAVREERGRDG